MPVLGNVVDLPWIIEKYHVDEVIIGLPESSHQELVGIVSLCEREKVGIRAFPDVFQIMASEVSIGDLGGLPLLTIRDVALRGWRLTLKRGMDVVVSAITLVLMSPFLLLTALLVKLDSPGPVFYIQERMGLDARPFKMIKFRSMREDAESDGPGWTTQDDPRRTKLGAIMRRFSIDELPQFINVLRQEMSVVGPRPLFTLPGEQFDGDSEHRLLVKPGITGLWQVSGRSDLAWADAMRLDLSYVDNCSMTSDLVIIAKTVRSVFERRGAY